MTKKRWSNKKTSIMHRPDFDIPFNAVKPKAWYQLSGISWHIDRQTATIITHARRGQRCSICLHGFVSISLRIKKMVHRKKIQNTILTSWSKNTNTDKRSCLKCKFSTISANECNRRYTTEKSLTKTANWSFKIKRTPATLLHLNNAPCIW
jgi:hypothetical protein